MATPTSIMVRLRGADADALRFRYRVAGTDLFSDFRILDLEPWRFADGELTSAAPPVMAAGVEQLTEPPARSESDRAERTYWSERFERSAGLARPAEDEAEFSRGWQDVHCRWNGRVGRLTVSGLGAIEAEIDDRAIHLRIQGRSEPGTLDRARRLSLDPGLIVALAERNIFSLRASAVVNGDALQAFVGLPGAGKSTFVSQLGSGVRASDDLLPLRRTHEGFEALPHIPQVRLDASEQFSRSRFEALPVSAVFVLAPLPANLHREVACIRLKPSQAFSELNRFVVGSRFFRPQVVGRNYFFCAELAALVPVFVMRFPRALTALPAMQEAIQTIMEDDDRDEAVVQTA